MRRMLGDDPALGQVPPLYLPMPQAGVGRVDQVEVGALPVFTPSSSRSETAGLLRNETSS
jgi:hypothetical protein